MVIIVIPSRKSTIRAEITPMLKVCALIFLFISGGNIL